MVPASAGRREPKKILHSELQGCDIFRELGEQRGAGGNAKCWGGSPFAGGKMLNAWGGPDTHGGGGFKMTLVSGKIDIKKHSVPYQMLGSTTMEPNI